ncbi:MAG TPA: hypothetical protein VK571_09950, partial [Gemmatimonadaceae bacterium]|nr:hypothetical protein [Gemmatimonadaceae bacterium]
MVANRLSLLTLVVLCACSRSDSGKLASDSSFTRLQQRGETAMGVDQYTSQHVFEPLADGGRIVLQRKETDTTGEATI